MGSNNVYVFNTTTSALGLSLNGYPISGINAATSTGNYAPVAATISRDEAVGPTTNAPRFGENNNLTVGYSNFSVAYKYKIDSIGYPEVPQNDDIQIYIFRSEVVVVVGSQPTNVQGTSPSQQETEALAEGAPEGGADAGGE